MHMIKNICAAFLLIIFCLPVAAHADNGRIVPSHQDEVQLSFAPLVRKVAPAVVNIYTRRTVTQTVNPFMRDPFFQQFFGDAFGSRGLSRQRVESALGSGVIINPDGLVVTNAHVIRGAEEITIVLPDGREFEAERAITDEPSDLAVLRIRDGGDSLPYVTLKPSESLEVGDLVLAIGNPFGVGQTVTSGIVSALARSSLNINDFNFFIQTDAAINPGNSGGPLVAMDGGVIGINTAIFSRTGGSLGIGFAIPSEMVASVVAAAESGQAALPGERGIIRPWLGISAQRVTADIAESLGLAIPNGILVANLHSASPLRAAGVRVGDVILRMNDRDIREPAEMKFRMATVPLGEHASFDIMRGGQRRIVKVEAIAPPDDPPRRQSVLDGQHPLSGATVANVNPAVAVELGINREDGVAVVDLQNNRPAARVVRLGDIIVEVNNVAVNTVDELLQQLARTGAGWNIVIETDGRRRQILIR